MKYQEKCPCCGHVRTAFIHKLNKPLVKALRQLVDFYGENKSGCNLQRDLNLTKNQYNNFQKLQYFDLVIKTPEGWLPSAVGMSFILGSCKSWDKVATIESTILNREHEAWKTHKGSVPKPISVQEIDVESWKNRQDYQSEKSRQTTLM